MKTLSLCGGFTFMREMQRESRQFLSRASHSESDLLSRVNPLICSQNIHNTSDSRPNSIQ